MLVIVNDKASYNNLYRKSLIASLQESGKTVISLGLLDSVASFFKVLYYCFSGSQLLSSNLKANLFVMLFCRGNTTFIINGLGRFRVKRFFRRGFLFLVNNKRQNTQIVFQNYADYRYYRRYSKHYSLFWVPGSGGTRRPVGTARQTLLVIQRDSKIMSVRDSLNEFSNLYIAQGKELNIIGCSVDNSEVKRYLPAYTCKGRYPQQDIFIEGSGFIQPEGYGEGVPHTLVDAICSGTMIYIKKGCFVRYGFYRLGFNFKPLLDEQGRPCAGGWGELLSSAEAEYAVSLKSVNCQYRDVILNRVGARADA